MIQWATFSICPRRIWKTAAIFTPTKSRSANGASATSPCAVSSPNNAAEFYREVFELTELEKPAGDPNHYLSDGKVTLAVMPWKISDFSGSGIERPALDHIGFKVESLTAFKADLEKFKSANPAPEDRPEKNPEREVRQKLLATCCFGQYHTSDPDGVLIDVRRISLRFLRISKRGVRLADGRPFCLDAA